MLLSADTGSIYAATGRSNSDTSQAHGLANSDIWLKCEFTYFYFDQDSTLQQMAISLLVMNENK